MSDNYWDQHPNNPINDKTDIKWCKMCQSNEVEDGSFNSLCEECWEKYSKHKMIKEFDAVRMSKEEYNKKYNTKKGV